jgi:enamine deaminase RidA (YjgF/YER057c/UK114 family)
VSSTPHSHRVVQPDHWPRPSGYSNAIAARGTQLHIAGQIGWDGNRAMADGFLAQSRQALLNIVEILSAAGAQPSHLVRLTWYVTSRAEYQREARALGAIYRETMGNWYPAMTAVEVSALMEHGAVVEIEATAVLPD